MQRLHVIHLLHLSLFNRNWRRLRNLDISSSPRRSDRWLMWGCREPGREGRTLLRSRLPRLEMPLTARWKLLFKRDLNWLGPLLRRLKKGLKSLIKLVSCDKTEKCQKLPNKKSTIYRQNINYFYAASNAEMQPRNVEMQPLNTQKLQRVQPPAQGGVPRCTRDGRVAMDVCSKRRHYALRGCISASLAA